MYIFKGTRKGGEFQCERKIGLSPKRYTLRIGKFSCEEAFQNLLKTCLPPGGSLDGYNWHATSGREGFPFSFSKIEKIGLIFEKSDVFMKFLSKCLISMKPSLPSKTSGCMHV